MTQSGALTAASASKCVCSVPSRNRGWEGGHMTLFYNLFVYDTTYSPVTWLIYMWYDSFISDVTHSYVAWLIHMWHDSFMRDIQMPAQQQVSADACAVYTLLICDMTHSCDVPQYYSYMCHDSFIYVPWLIHICAMTPWYSCHDTFRCLHGSEDLKTHVRWMHYWYVTWLIHMIQVIIICATWHVTWLFICVMHHISHVAYHVSHVTYHSCVIELIHTWQDSFIRDIQVPARRRLQTRLQTLLKIIGLFCRISSLL